MTPALRCGADQPGGGPSPGTPPSAPTGTGTASAAPPAAASPRRPHPRERALLAEAGLVLEPHLDPLARVGRLDRPQLRPPFFKRVLRRRVGVGVVRPRAQVAVAQACSRS